jgi:hypothetical protein
METEKQCILEIKKLYVEAQVWFAVLKRTCKHHGGSLCKIPFVIYPYSGIIQCELEKCPLVRYNIEV